MEELEAMRGACDSWYADAIQLLIDEALRDIRRAKFGASEATND